MPMLHHHHDLFCHHSLSDNDDESSPLAREDSSPHEQFLHDLMTAHAPWSDTAIGWMFTLVMLTSVLAAVVCLGVSVCHTVFGQY